METYEYSAFGLMQILDATGAEIAESGVSNPYGYTGRRWDKESGLWYYRNRMYSPGLGRFPQRDPAGYVDGMNLYAYVKNNPIIGMDPTGLSELNTVRTVVTTINILDVFPVGMIPVYGQVVGEALDIAAFIGSEYVLLYDCGQGNISSSQFWAGTGLNVANLALGSLGNLLTGLGNLALSGVEGGILLLNYHVTSP